MTEEKTKTEFKSIKEAMAYANERGFVRSIPWWRAMVYGTQGIRRIESELFYRRRLIHINELNRVISEKPELPMYKKK